MQPLLTVSDQGPPQETDDRLEPGHRVHHEYLKEHSPNISPFIRSAYLTEFTAADLEGINQRKSRLESVLGSL